MNQQLVISKEIVSFFTDKLPTFRRNDAIDVIEYIEQNLFVSDNRTVHFNSILDKIDELEPSVKRDEIKKIISYWIQEKKYFTECEYKMGNENEINLTWHTQDKIYFKPLLAENEITDYYEKQSELEIHNLNTFLNPQPMHRLKHIPTIIPLQEGVFYDIVKIINPFIRHAKYVQIEDQYLPNIRASYNLFKIVENFPDKRFKLIFLDKESFFEYKSGNKREEMEKRYDLFIKQIHNLNKKGYKISYKDRYRIKKHRDRYIFTEEFQILIPGGFDFLDNKGFLINTDKEKPERREIIIEKRNFPLDNK